MGCAAQRRTGLGAVRAIGTGGPRTHGLSSETLQVIVERGAKPEDDLAGGAQALSEIEYGRLFERWGLPRPTGQAIRLDHRGRRRYLDVEWTLPGGAKKGLEIDGVGHLEPTRWYSDLLRAADITAADETPILRLPATAARIDQELVAAIQHRDLGLDRRVA